MQLTPVHPLCHTRSVQSKQRSEQEEGLRHFPHSIWEMDFDGEERGSPLLQLTKTSGTATSAQTLGNIVVSILGTGVLGLPYAFRIAGWLAGSVGILITGLAIYYCMLLLVECRRKLEGDAPESDLPAETQTYGDVGAFAFGVTGRFLVEFLILISYAGSAVASLIFTSQNLSSVAHSSTTAGSGISVPAFIFLLLLPLEIVLSFVRSLSLLAPFSAFATLCNVFAMALVIKEDISKFDNYSFESRSAFKGAWSIPFACGVAVFCFEAFGMTLPLERSMAEPRKFSGVLLQAFIGIALAYICFGTFGYLAYGEQTRDIITLNLPSNWSTIIVKVGLCTAVAFTFPLAVLPVHDIIELKLKSSKWFQKLCHNSETKDWLGSQLARILVVVALAILATAAPGFVQLISIMGSTICALISFVLPAAFHLKIMGSSLGRKQRILDYFILLVGLVFALHGIYAAFQQFYEY